MDLKLNTKEAVEVAEQEADTLAEGSRIVVNSQPTFEKAKEQLKAVKQIKKFVKEKKESITKPLNEALKNTRALFKPVEDKVETIEKYLNVGVLKYNRKLIEEQQKREIEAQKKIEEAEKKGEEINIDKAVKKLENTNEKIEQIRTRKVKKFKIVDANKIPRLYLMENETAIRRAMMDGIEIEGIEYYEEEIAVNSY